MLPEAKRLRDGWLRCVHLLVVAFMVEKMKEGEGAGVVAVAITVGVAFYVDGAGGRAAPRLASSKYW